MDKQAIDDALARVGKDRRWLAERSGYSYEYVRNTLAPAGPALTDKFEAAVRRVLGEADRERKGIPAAGSVWDGIYFTGSEVVRIDRGRRAGGYSDLPSLYRDAVLHFADELIEKERPVLRVAGPEKDYEVNVIDPAEEAEREGNDGGGDLNIKRR